MKIKLLSIIFLLIFFSKAIAHSGHYKEVNILEYELFRNNKSIGYHNYTFTRDNNILNVKSSIDFKIRKLGVDLYKYEGTTEEQFKDDQLIRFISNTNQNKKIKKTEIKFDKEKNILTISGSENQLTSPKEYPVGTWWDHEIIQAKAQISAVSGRIIHQKVTFLGKEEISLYGKKYNSLRFNLSSTDESLPKKKKT